MGLRALSHICKNCEHEQEKGAFDCPYEYTDECLVPKVIAENELTAFETIYGVNPVIQCTKAISFNLQLKVREATDEFIFQTVKPFCEGTVECKISKRLLKKALIEYFQNHPEERSDNDGSE